MSYHIHASNYLDNLAKSLEDNGFEVEWNGEILNALSQNGQIWVIHFHNYLQQIWLASPVSGAHHFKYEPPDNLWLCTRTNITLDSMIQQELNV